MTEHTSNSAVKALTIVGAFAVFALSAVMSNGVLFSDIGGALAHFMGHDATAGMAVGGSIGGILWVGGVTVATATGGPATASAGFVAGVKSSSGAVGLGSM